MPCIDHLTPRHRLITCDGCGYAERGDPEDMACAGMSVTQVIVALNDLGLRAQDMVVSDPDVNVS